MALVVRLARRMRTLQRELTSPEAKRRRPSLVRTTKATAGAHGTNRRATRGRRCPHRLFGASPGFHGPMPVTSVLAESSDRRGGQSDVSQVLEKGWIQRVLVDNKSVAEIGERHLVCLGLERFGAKSTRQTSKTRRPITVTGGKLRARGKGASSVWSSTISVYGPQTSQPKSWNQPNQRRPGSRNRGL